MTIGIDIRATIGKKAGKGWMIYYLVKALSKLPEAHKHKFILFCSRPPEFDFELPTNFEIREMPGRGWRWHWRLARRLKKSDEVDIYLSPASFIVPALVKNKCVVIVHDLVSRLYPKGHNRKATFIESFTLRPTLKKALSIIAISANTKQDIVQEFPFTKGKVSVIPLAGGDVYRPVKDRQRLQTVIRQFNLPEKYILFVGTLEPRKNISRIIAALTRTVDQELKLVVVGKKGWQWEEIFDRVDTLGLKDRVQFLDYVDTGDLVAMYSLAQAFVFPSLYEGFGLPVLEAMQCGCPVVTSKVSSLPEVAGEAAILVNPRKVKSIAVGIDRAIEYQDDLRLAGLAQARRFSWEKTAAQTLRIIEEANDKR
ncbi:glycosyltransferase family 4 protein [Patescibacteria group bacterium]